MSEESCFAKLSYLIGKVSQSEITSFFSQGYDNEVIKHLMVTDLRGEMTCSNPVMKFELAEKVSTTERKMAKL